MPIGEPSRERNLRVSWSKKEKEIKIEKERDRPKSGGKNDRAG